MNLSWLKLILLKMDWTIKKLTVNEGITGAVSGDVSTTSLTAPDAAAGSDANGSDMIVSAGAGDGSGEDGRIIVHSVVKAPDAAAGSDANGSNLVLQSGLGDGAGDDGLIFLTPLPDADPQVEGALWNNNGVLSVSAG